jgi:hypothetical protein
MGVKLYRIAGRGWVRGVLATWLILTAVCGVTVTRASDIAEVVAQVSVDSYADHLQNDLYTHAGEERYLGPQHDLARQNIQDRFESFGLATSLDPFTYAGFAGANVVGVLPGVIRPDEIYILGAHYDSVRGSPGAYDNASGVATVLEAARVLSLYRFEETLVFIAFDREEQGLIGSAWYAQEHRWDRIRGMISADCIGYHPYSPGDPAYSRVGVRYYPGGIDMANGLQNALGLYAGLTGVLSQSSGGSDHVPFGSAGFTSVLVISDAGCSPFYHMPSDSLDKLDDTDYDYGTQITRGLVGYLATEAGLAPVRVSPDFNADWHVDIEDLTLLIERWGQNDPAFDIAPPPAGDGIVDQQDLEGFMYYWEQEIPEPGLLAHWNLDEAAGTIAYDAAGANDADVAGHPLWQPEGGQIVGAIELDGVDDYIHTAFFVDPSERSFSVFAWVKGGVPGQVILSQADGADWLVASAPDGVLATELKSAARTGKILQSAINVADGAWHRVGLVWDGSNRILYVDDIEVAKDTQVHLPSSTGGLYIGAGKGLEPGRFWSGLIDDVRLYDRAVKP